MDNEEIESDRGSNVRTARRCYVHMRLPFLATRPVPDIPSQNPSSCNFNESRAAKQKTQRLVCWVDVPYNAPTLHKYNCRGSKTTSKSSSSFHLLPAIQPGHDPYTNQHNPNHTDVGRAL